MAVAAQQMLPAMDPQVAAKTAGLRYVSDAEPGIRRVRAGPGFSYRDPDGDVVRDKATLARIRSLVIPPAWTDVWIAPEADGHIQATGRDARGRKQYRYHPKWRAVRDETKYDKMQAFAEALPRIRARVAKDLRRRGMPREKVLAAVVRMLETTFVRVGNDEYARTNRSYGLTTIRNAHAQVRGAKVRLRFRGKSGKDHDVSMEDPTVARIVRRCQDMPGQELFCYEDEDGEVRDVKSQDVNDYIREAAGEAFTAKDFRTWGGTLLALAALCEVGPFESATAGKRNVVAAVKRVAQRLGNTPAVCKKAYIHPAVLDAYLQGRIQEITEQGDDEEAWRELAREEASLMRLLAWHAERDEDELVDLLARSMP